MLRSIKRFLGNEVGVTFIEYALIAALVAIVCVTILTTMGTQLSKLFNMVTQKLSAA